MSIDTLSPPQSATDSLKEPLMEMSPRTEIDQNGLTRTIFEINGTTFSFRGREETPIYPTLQESNPQYLGRGSVLQYYDKEKPINTKSEVEYFKSTNLTDEQINQIEAERVGRWQSEKDRFANYEKTIGQLQEQNSGKPEHLIVEQSLFGFLSLLEKLQPENPHWRQQLQAVENGTYDNESLNLIDMITAVDAIGINKNRAGTAEVDPPLGEAVVLSALLGDKQAADIVEQAVRRQNESELAAQKKEVEAMADWANSDKMKDVEAFKPEDLVVVHSTGYKPQKIENGYVIKTTHDATGYPRATIHTAINHKAESHLFGHWDDQDFVLIAGFDGMLKANGSPNSINGADTWWTRNPGEALSFPGATLIAPAEQGQSELFQNTENGELRYKSSGFTEEDIRKIIELSADSDQIERIRTDKNGNKLDINNEKFQHGLRNILRDTLVRREIAEIRGKQLLWQYDDKFMDSEIQKRLDKMAVAQKLTILSHLHNGGSQEHDIETSTTQGERVWGYSFENPKVRRVAYASGMMNAGGLARQTFLEQQKYKDQLW